MTTGGLPGGLSSDSYLDRRLRPIDAEHYSAAGLLPYRRRSTEGVTTVEVLMPRERPWNSFSQAYDPTSWNFFGGKRVPRQERSVEFTAVRSFLECFIDVEGTPEQAGIFNLIQSGFEVWYPTGKFGLVLVEVPEGSLWEDLPAAYRKYKEGAGPQDEFKMLPSGVKKWAKQIEELGWVSGDTLTADGAEVSDLVGSMLDIDELREFLTGDTDPAKSLPEGEAVSAPRGGGGRGGKGRGKGRGKGGKGGDGNDGGFGQGHSYGNGGGMMMGMGMGMGMGVGMPMGMAQPVQHMPQMPMGMGPMMYPGGPVMSPMVFPQSNNQSSPGMMQRQMYGEQLYTLVQPMSPSPNIAQKITGMLLELPQNELIMNLNNREELQLRVKEALEVLKEDGIVS